jgi:predicted Zn-dependent protease with MMP-like domain
MARTDPGKLPDQTLFEEFITRFDDLVTSDPVTALAFVDEAPESIRTEGEWRLCRARATRAARGAAAAAEYLETIVAELPEYADAHYDLAQAYREAGRERDAIRHHLETLRLDKIVDQVSECATEDLLSSISAQVGRVLSALPRRLKERVSHVPILLVDRPSEELVSTGFDSRAWGMFEGANVAEVGGDLGAAEPAAITLFVQCLLDVFDADEDELLDQVRVTVLHEIGHFFGLDEAQLAEIGLD